MTGRDLLKAALVSINQLAPGEEPDEYDGQVGLDRLNDWLDSLALEGLTIPSIARVTKVLASSTASYSIGAGGDINTARPDDIKEDDEEGARLILDNTASPVTEIPLKVFSPQDWMGIAQKDLQSGLAAGIYYDRTITAGRGRIYPWPIPNVGTTTLVLYLRQALTEYTDLDTTILYPRGYRRFLRTNLAVELAGDYGVEVPKRVDQQASDSKAKVKRANLRRVEARCDPSVPGMGAGEGFNYRTGESA